MTEATSSPGCERACRRWFARFVRAAVIGMGTLLLGSRLASAYAENSALEGLSLLEQLGPSLVGEPQGFELNGERIWFASKVTDLQVPELLDAVERDCARRSSGLLLELEKLPSSLRTLLPTPGKFLLARSGGASGQLVCFTQSAERSLSLIERSRNFMHTGDLAAFGNVRYVVAKREAGADSTHVMAVWTEGHFNLRTLFPTNGDSPGSDSRVVSRPEDSVRLLSARRVGGGDAVRLYRTSEPAMSVLDRSSRELSEKGFLVAVMPPSRASRELAQTSRAFFKDGASVIVSARNSSVSGTVVAIVESESTGRAVVQREAP